MLAPTSLNASWIDVDGSMRDEKHSGVDGGRLNDEILAPAPGTVRAVWKADWGWGREGALLIVHTREELGLEDGPAFYYSEFDHRHATAGQRVPRSGKTSSVANAWRMSRGPAAMNDIWRKFTGRSGKSKTTRP